MRQRKKIKNLTNGYICRCGRTHEYSSYVYAHTFVTLLHKCECGVKVEIDDLHATEMARDTQANAEEEK